MEGKERELWLLITGEVVREGEEQIEEVVREGEKLVDGGKRKKVVIADCRRSG